MIFGYPVQEEIQLSFVKHRHILQNPGLLFAENVFVNLVDDQRYIGIDLDLLIWEKLGIFLDKVFNGFESVFLNDFGIYETELDEKGKYLVVSQV